MMVPLVALVMAFAGAGCTGSAAGRRFLTMTATYLIRVVLRPGFPRIEVPLVLRPQRSAVVLDLGGGGFESFMIKVIICEAWLTAQMAPSGHGCSCC